MSDHGTASVLVVDDSRENLLLLTGILREYGYRPRAVLSGELALQAVRSEPPGLVLLDIRMPGMDGIQVCEQLKADDGLRDIPVIFISASDSAEDKVRAFAAGGVDYVTMPFQLEEVLARVGTHLRLRRALERERELGELKSRFISMASHEFRTPLTAIHSSAEMLERYGEAWTLEKRHLHLARIQEAARNMTELLEDVLLVGRAEARGFEFDPAPMDLAAFCRELAEETQEWDTSGHTVRVSVEGEPVAAVFDERLLRHIVGNLLGNAVKYSDPGSGIRLDLAWHEDEVEIRVSDQGMGIPSADLDRLFEPFHRAANVTHTQGTGLGLAIVERAVDRHNGRISVESTVGQGSTFTVTLPASTDALSATHRERRTS